MRAFLEVDRQTMERPRVTVCPTCNAPRFSQTWTATTAADDQTPVVLQAFHPALAATTNCLGRGPERLEGASWSRSTNKAVVGLITPLI